MFLWFMGPTALLVTTIIVVVFLGMSDYIKVTPALISLYPQVPSVNFVSITYIIEKYSAGNKLIMTPPHY